MNELQDYWNEQRLYLMINPTYNHMLRLTENLYIDSHKRNVERFIPIDDLIEYKKDRRELLGIKPRTKNQKSRKRIPRKTTKVIENFRFTSKEILTDTDISDDGSFTKRMDKKQIKPKPYTDKRTKRAKQMDRRKNNAKTGRIAENSY